MLDEKISALEQERESLQSSLESHKQEKFKSIATISRLEEANNNAKQAFEQKEKLLEARFENLANKILENNSQKFATQNKASLDMVLSPLKEKIQKFEEKVEKSSKENIQWNTELKGQISGLKDLNIQITKEADKLTKALKGDSKVQGDWGEIQLERILESAGLEKGTHYETQGAIRDEDGNLKRPDVVVNLPDNKNLIIDSKVSLTAYERFMSTDDESEKNLYLKQHIAAIKDQVKDLESKNYQDLYGLNSPDYVMMFVPVESAFHVALQTDHELYAYAINKNIILVTTSTLMAVMRTVAFIWKQDNQTKNVLEIARESGAMYDKFVGFTEDLKKLGHELDKGKNMYANAMNKLMDGKGNLITRVEKIKKLGAQAKKSMDERMVERAMGNSLLNDDKNESNS